MKVKLPQLFLCLLCSACVSTPPLPKASDTEISKARVDLLLCGRDALPRLDDGISSATIIAAAIMQECKIEANQLFDLVMQGTSDPIVREDVRRQVGGGKNFIPIVLKYRAQKNR